MTISVQSFAEKYENKSIDYDKQFGAQCVDLFNFYNSEVVGGDWIGTPATNGARDLYEVDSSVRSKFYKKLAANSQLQVGDVLVYGPPHGRYIVNGVQVFFGHVNIYLGNDHVIQQNARWNQKTTIDKLFKNGLLGILRPLRFIGENSPQKESTQTPYKNKHVIQKDDTFWGLEEKNGWDHGTLQQLNPGLEPKALSIGSSIVIPTKSTAEPHPDKTYYVIRAGDTFWGLEDAWQLQHGSLQQLNPDLEPRALQIGARIRRT